METYLLLGSNLGDRHQKLTDACRLISSQCGPIIKQSSIWQSSAWGYSSKNNFLNQVVVIQWCQQPEELMQVLLKIEKDLGRIRFSEKGYSDRVIDIDILAIENLVHQSDFVIIPHVNLHQRAFALIPMQEVAENWQHPVLGITVGQMLSEMDVSGVELFMYVHRS